MPRRRWLPARRAGRIEGPTLVATSSSALLAAGETVGVVAPGFAMRPEPLESGLQTLALWGYPTVVGRSVRRRRGYFAGDDAARLDDLVRMSTDPAVGAIWFARGGYGTARLLDPFLREIGRKRLPTFVGFSDATALFAALLARRSMVVVHGPLVVELGDRRTVHRASLDAVLAGTGYGMRVRASGALVNGSAEGRLMGGNLTVLTSLIGTEHFPDLHGAILFLEEIGEEVYRIDRMLTQWRASGALRGVRGVLLGQLATPKRRRFPPDRRLRDVLLETFGPLGVPVLAGAPCGHRSRQRALPLGGLARIDAGRARFAVEAQPVRRGR